ncbi:MAG: GAF domain-containing SpoIIE family protein phosphatase [Nocardioides sp.]
MTATPFEHTWQPDRGLVEHLDLPAVAIDGDGAVVYANAAAKAALGDVLGSTVQNLFDVSAHGALDEILRQVTGGTPWSGDLAVRTVGGGAEVQNAVWSPVHTDGSVSGALVLLDEARKSRVTRLAAQLRRVADVTAAMLSATSVTEVAEVVTEHLTDAAGATVGSLSLLVDEETLSLVGLRGGAEGAAARWATYPVDGSTPAGEAVLSGRPLVVSGRDELLRRYPGIESGDGERSLVCLPLTVADRVIGVVSVSFPGRRSVDAAEMQYLGIMADTCAQALDRIRAQDAAADREAKLRYLAEATERLTADLDYETTLEAVAQMAVPWFADWCAIALADDGVLRTLSVAHANPEHAELVAYLQEHYPATPDSEHGGYAVLRSGQAELVPEIPDELLARSARDEEHLRLLRLLNFRSALAVPLKVRDRVLGVLTWVTGEGGRRFGPDDLAFADDLARRAAAAIDNAELHSQLRDMALRLQEAVLPERLPDLPGWDLGVCYLPAGRTGAGGDFYDVVPLPDGRLAFFVGDVMGRGVAATSVMAQMRSSLRTLIALDPDPASVMARLDRVFESWHPDQLVTVLYGVLDPARELLTVVNAGHPAPVVRGAGAPAVLATPDTLILGVGGGDRTVVSHAFRSGDVLLAYTDGLTERRGEDLDTGTSRVLEACRELAPGPLDPQLRTIVDDSRDPDRDDDVALLAIRRT